VLPAPPTAGQHQRVLHTLEAARTHFEVVFVTSSSAVADPAVASRTRELCDELVVIPVTTKRAWRLFQVAVDIVSSAVTGLKRSNFDISRELSYSKVAAAVDVASFDIAFVHYWHATETAQRIRGAGPSTVLDMHDVLWRARGSQLRERRWVPEWFVRRTEKAYRRREERAWGSYDAVVAINTAEAEDAKSAVPDGVDVWHIPMGVRLERWPYCWQPTTPPRLAYYGGLSTRARELAALRCYERVMPRVWARYPDAELWLVGSNPTAKLRALADDPRVTVTGFVEEVNGILGSMTAVLCPFSGRFGFRSRLVEVLATGTPVVATPDAVHGMGLRDGEGVLLHEDDEGMAGACCDLIENRVWAADQSKRGRESAEALGWDATYGKLVDALAGLAARQR